MTTHTERPNYSSVPEMRYDCINTNDRQCLIDKLLEYNVSVIAYSIKKYIKQYSALAFIHGYISDCVSKDKSEAIHTWVTREDFLVPFENIHKEWEEMKAKQFNKLRTGDYWPDVVKPTLLVPTDEEIERRLVYGCVTK